MGVGERGGRVEDDTRLGRPPAGGPVSAVGKPDDGVFDRGWRSAMDAGMVGIVKEPENGGERRKAGRERRAISTSWGKKTPPRGKRGGGGF